MSCPYCRVSVVCHCDDYSEIERRLQELDDIALNDARQREWDPEDMFPDDMLDNARVP